jgi:hypothetical protein
MKRLRSTSAGWWWLVWVSGGRKWVLGSSKAVNAACLAVFDPSTNSALSRQLGSAKKKVHLGVFDPAPLILLSDFEHDHTRLTIQNLHNRYYWYILLVHLMVLSTLYASHHTDLAVWDFFLNTYADRQRNSIFSTTIMGTWGVKKGSEKAQKKVPIYPLV